MNTATTTATRANGFYETCQLKRSRSTKAQMDSVRAAIVAVLREAHPMTVRQAYYQLVAKQIIENSRASYQKISNLLVELRKSGDVPWEWIEDRLRRPRKVAQWGSLADFVEKVKASYRRDVWATQPYYVECWLEKDALSGIFESVLHPFGVTLNVGRGFDGWTSIHDAAERYGDGKGVVVLYWGDFDPSGEDMVRSLRERLAWFPSTPDIVKCALTADDIVRYNLPPDAAKRTDSRSAAFIAEHGDVSVELDALPLEVLRARINAEVSRYIDFTALQSIRTLEQRELRTLERALEQVSG